MGQYGGIHISVRSQLEAYIAVEMGMDFLRRTKNQTVLTSVRKEINSLTKQLKLLEIRRNVLEMSLEKANGAEQTATEGKPNQRITEDTPPRKETKSNDCSPKLVSHHVGISAISFY